MNFRKPLSFLVCLLLALAPARAGNITGKLSLPTTRGPILGATINFSLNAPNMKSGSFVAVTTAVSCYTNRTDGSIVGVPDPAVGPSMSQNLASGTLPAATYYVRFSYWNASGDSAASPELTIALTGQGTLIVNPPGLQPAAASGWKLYLGTSSGAETLQQTITGFGSASQSTSLVAGAAFPVANSSVCNLTFQDEFLSSPSWYNVSIQGSAGQTINGLTRTGKAAFYGGPNGTVDVSTGLPDYDGRGIFSSPLLLNPAGGSKQVINGPLDFNGFGILGVGFGKLTESSAPGCLAGFDFVWADLAAHRLKECDNGGTAVQIVHSGVDVNTADQVTATHLAAALPVLQGGTGVTAAQGNGSKIQLSSGTTTNGDVVSYDINSNAVDSGKAAPSGAFVGTTDVQTITNKNISCRTLSGIRCADQFAGADCGAKINAASTDLAGPGEIWVNQACGMTISTAITQAATNQTIRFIQGGTWSVSALVTLSQAGCVVGLPGGSTVKPVILQAAASSNLPVMVQFNTGQNCLIDMELDGNKANNPTGGVAVKMTSNQRPEFRHNNIINFKSHGIWIIGTTINDSCCGKMEGNIILNNDGDGIFVQKTSDWFVQDSNELESNGLQQAAVPQIPTVNCTNATPTVCTWQTGPKWSTDSSLVNTHVLLNGVLNTVSSIGSTTSVTLAANQGALTGATLQWGSGVETQNANAWRVIGNDFGQNAAMGWDANNCDSTTNGSSNNVFEGNQWANLGPDILITGFDPVHSAYCGRFTHIVGNQFVGNTAAFPTGINYNSIQLQDGGAEVIADNLFQAQQGTSPVRARGIFIGESAAGRDQNKTVNANQYQGTFTTAPITCNTQNTGASCRNVIITARFGAMCTTAASAGSTCTTTYTWPNGGFVDANYTAACFGHDPSNGTGTLSYVQGGQTATSIQIILTSTGLANTYGGVNCMAMHD